MRTVQGFPFMGAEITFIGDRLAINIGDGLSADGGWFQFRNGQITLIAPASFNPELVLQKDYANTDQTYPRLRGSADTLTLSRINLTDRVTLLAKGFGDTPLDANQLASGTVPGARLPANVQLKPVAESDVTNLVTDLAAKAPARLAGVDRRADQRRRRRRARPPRSSRRPRS